MQLARSDVGLEARYAYDPFGKRRRVNGAYDADGKLVYDWNGSGTDRRYTGQVSVFPWPRF
ncbi:hypothetical protein GJA_1320 [Janthinobacterium agaricidamnosum NBRC 102515 = DSM 9628]|uniref:Uncharacterized protein n=1 Tax=Janthinobacterium agaricidamnosum NBRC 102515 = DSM 9628 TaxID=1349767 RepID=W0V3Q9_9BURK|nr:hypothetical protein GJA_1320 [Janthinobacterium agaricidamnosum NBRC 102515 = DSM 9628]